MYCTKCGNKVNNTDKFCAKCGAKINNESYTKQYIPSDNSNTQNNKTAINSKEIKSNTKKTAILVSAIAASVLCVVVILIVVFSANSSLESKLTAHNWTGTGYSKNYSVMFYKNGTYSMTLSSGTTKEGSWSVNGNVLKISGRLGSGEYNWYDNLSDSDISNGLAKSQYYSWYVSDNYFVICSDCVFGADKKEVFEAN